MTAVREQLVAAVRPYRGAPWRHLGRSPLGVDCLGLLILAGRDAGLLPPGRDWLGYSTNTADYRLVEEMEACEFLERLPSWRDAREGDVLLQKFHSARPASHVLVVTRFDGTYWWAMHAPREGRSVVETRVAHTERCFAAFRLKGVA